MTESTSGRENPEFFLPARFWDAAENQRHREASESPFEWRPATLYLLILARRGRIEDSRAKLCRFNDNRGGADASKMATEDIRH